LAPGSAEAGGFEFGDQAVLCLLPAVWVVDGLDKPDFLAFGRAARLRADRMKRAN
jgi:hypothetical protein